jgi:uncharacterized sulfatase
MEKQIALLGDPNRGVRYWAAVGLHAQGKRATAAHAALIRALDDPSASVRIEAAGVLVSLGDSARPLAVLVAALQSADGNSVAYAARTLQLLGEKARPVMPQMRAMLALGRKPALGGDGAYWLALHAALGKLDQPKPKTPLPKAP